MTVTPPARMPATRGPDRPGRVPKAGDRANTTPAHSAQKGVAEGARVCGPQQVAQHAAADDPADEVNRQYEKARAHSTGPLRSINRYE